MFRSLGEGASHLQVGGTVLIGPEAQFMLRFLNHENTKKLEFHEIFESRISRIHLDFTEKTISQRDSLRRRLFFSFFRAFLFPFVVS